MPNARAFPTVRDPLLSLLQSAAAALERARPATPATATLRADIDRLVARGDTPRTTARARDLATGETCATLGLALLEACLHRDSARRRELESRLRFSPCDPAWLESLTDYATRFLPDGIATPVPYRRWTRLEDFVLDAPAATLRIGLLSDWGTGTAEADAVAALLARQRPDVVIHLGDVYYAGTHEECELHFLAPLRRHLPDARQFTLCGNHDVYSGGAGYYGLLDHIGQPASYLCLRAPDRAWQILAADTGLNDRDPFDVAAHLTRLEPAEIAWHADKIANFPGRTLLLTHHQPFSAYAQIGPRASHDPTNPNLLAAHARLAQAGPIDAWFWGHEHALALYAPYRGVARGRNVGHGAIPVFPSTGARTPLAGLHDPPALAADTPLDVADGAYAHGFALLDLSPDRIEASYWQTTRPDAPLHRETISPATGPALA